MIYYIADTHFRDQSIFDKCKRPYKSILDMDEVLEFVSPSHSGQNGLTDHKSNRHR